MGYKGLKVQGEKKDKKSKIMIFSNFFQASKMVSPGPPSTQAPSPPKKSKTKTETGQKTMKSEPRNERKSTNICARRGPDGAEMGQDVAKMGQEG